MTLLALLILGLAAVVVAVSAAADPANLNNPPTEDWSFDSGTMVTISNKDWDINYNITVWNGSHLVLDSCTFTIYDMYSLNQLYIAVMWDGMLTLTDCTFTTSGTTGYFIYLEGDTLIDGCTISGLRPGSMMGGITAYYIDDLEFVDTTVKDVDGVAIYTYNCNLTGSALSVTNSGGDSNDEAAFMAIYSTGDYDAMYTLDFTSSNFNDNNGKAFGFRAWSCWADITATFDGCRFERNYMRGLDVHWGRDGSSESSNASLDLVVTGCFFTSNRHDGFRYQQNDVRYDGTGTIDILLEDCTFSKGQGSGAFVNVNYADQTFNIKVDGCDFIDNAVGGRAGLALSNRYIYSVWNAEVTDCTFTNNDQWGLHIEHRSSTVDGGSYVISNCEFSGHTEDMYIYNRRHGEYFNDFTVQDCDFTNSRDAGIHQYLEYMQLPIEMHFVGLTFHNSDGHGLSSTGYYEESDGVHWDVRGCTFTDLGGRAISFGHHTVRSGAILEVSNCQADRTAGIEFTVMDSLSTVSAVHQFYMMNVSVTNATTSAIEAVTYGYYGCKLDMVLEGVHVADAMFNGIRAISTSNFASSSDTIDANIQLKDVTIITVSGNGLNLGTDRVAYAGTRRIAVDGLVVKEVNKGAVLSGLKGELRNTRITDSFKEDVMAISTDVELYQPEIDALTDEAVQVVESGSVKFWYTLKVFVEWDTGTAIEGAVVTITDNQHTLIGVYTQEDETGLPQLLLNSYQFRESGRFTRSPYLLNVTYRAIQATMPVNLDTNREVTVQLADHVPPKVFINEPMAGHIQKAMSVKVRGSSFDTESAVDTVEVSLDGVTWVPMASTTSWEHTFTVDEDDVIDSGGVFTVRARATDSAGNTASTSTSFEIDPFPPELRVDYPSNGMQTNKPTITVRGVTESGAMVMVNGIEVSLAGTLFQSQVDLVEGPNTITVAAFDALGNSKQMKMEVVLDTKAPYLVLLSPMAGEMFIEDTITVGGQAENDLTIYVNGNMLGPAHYNNGTFSYAVSLVRGSNLVTVSAVDMAGNELSIERSVVLDDVPPRLAVQSPRDASHQNSMSILVAGTTDPDSTVMIDGNLVDLDHGLFSYTMVGVEGPNTVTVSASDVAGNVVEVVLTVTIDTVAPSLTITSPAGGTDLVNVATYTLVGMTNGATAVWLNGVEHALEVDGSFSIPVTLLEGGNRFIVTAVDMAGNQLTMERTVTLDTHKPPLVVQVPGIIDGKSGKVYRTDKGDPATMRITGYTDTGVQIRIGTVLVPVSAEGYFVYDFPLTLKSVNAVTITAESAAGNVAQWEISVKHEFTTAENGEGFDWGLLILVVGIILLAIVIFIGYRRLTAAEQRMEIREVEEEEVLAPTMMPEVEEDLAEEEEEEEEEEVHELTAPPERPRTGTSRPVSEPSEEVTIEIEEKDLGEMDADADVDADESEQEGI